MARLFPFRSETETGDRMPRIVGIEDEHADAVFSALSSETAREVYGTLAEEPGTPSDVAEEIDSSIQNVRYHLENLEEAELIEVVDTWYSSRGNEMNVYATANGPLIVTGDPSMAERLKAALSRYLGGIAVLAGGSALAYYGLEWIRNAGLGSDDAQNGDAGGPLENGNAGDGNGGNGDANGDENGAENGEENGSETENGNETDGGNGNETDGGNGNETENGTDDVGNESAVDEGDGLENESASGDAFEPIEGGETGPADGAGTDADVAGANDAALEFGGGDALGDGAAGADVGDGGASVLQGEWTAAVDAASGGLEVALAVAPPGLLFFAGSVATAAVTTGYVYWTTN